MGDCSDPRGVGVVVWEIVRGGVGVSVGVMEGVSVGVMEGVSGDVSEGEGVTIEGT
jgi:hypothetical protein